MRTLIARHHDRSIVVGEAPINGKDSIPAPPSTIQTPDGTIYVSNELASARQHVGILLGAAGGIGAGILGSWLVRKF